MYFYVFQLHWQVRDIPNLCRRTLQCCHQLASLNENILHKTEDRCHYLCLFLENLIELLLKYDQVIYSFYDSFLATIIWNFTNNDYSMYTTQKCNHHNVSTNEIDFYFLLTLMKTKQMSLFAKLSLCIFFSALGNCI